MQDPIIQTQKLTKQFGTFVALRECDLSVERGEVFGLLGPNGAGKSTLLRLLLGFLNPTNGTASIDGLDCLSQRVAVHQRLSYLPGDARLSKLMRGRQVLKLFCQLRSDASLERANHIAERLELDLSRWVGLMSTGMRQKLALAICLSAECPLLILDEPTANLDPTIRGRVLDMVNEARQTGSTVVFSSHVLSEIEETCDRVGILRRGELVHLEALSSLKRQHRIEAQLNGSPLTIPDNLKHQIHVQQHGDKIQIETPSELPVVLKWLADLPLTEVYVQPIGLRAVYDRFHNDQTPAQQVEIGS